MLLLLPLVDCSYPFHRHFSVSVSAAADLEPPRYSRDFLSIRPARTSLSHTVTYSSTADQRRIKFSAARERNRINIIQNNFGSLG